MGCFIGRLCAGNFQLSIVKNNKNQGGCKKMSYQEIYKKWCTDPYFDAQTQEELKNLEGNEKEIEDCFYRQLEFAREATLCLNANGIRHPYLSF